MQHYEPFIEVEMQNFYNILPENYKRLFASLSADQIGYGGTQYISNLLKCSPNVISKGKQELDDFESVKKNYRNRQRKAGGGRKKKL